MSLRDARERLSEAKAAWEAEKAAAEREAAPIVDGLGWFAKWCRRLYGLGVEHDFDGGTEDDQTVEVIEDCGSLQIWIHNGGWGEDRQSLTLDPERVEAFIEVLRRCAEPLRGADCRAPWERER